MRDSLTVLAILLICLLTAALVAPFFIDWTVHRRFIEAKLSEAAGTKVAIAGPIAMRFLPQPIVRLGAVTIGDAAPGQPRLTAAELDVDVTLTALMRGDLQVGKAVLRSPRLDLVASDTGAVSMQLPGLGDPRRIQFQEVVVDDGTLTLSRPGHPLATLSGLNFNAEATSLLGPFKATGTFGTADEPHPFRLSTGVFENGGIRLKLGLQPTRTLPAVDIDGTASRDGGAAGAPRFAGLVTVKGALPLSDSLATIPWILTGHVDANGDNASAGDLEFRAGSDMRAVSATGTGALAFGAEPRATLRLHGPQVNLDRLAVLPDTSDGPPPKGGDLLARLNRNLGQDGALGLPGKLDLDWAFDTASLGSLTVLGVEGHVGFDGSKPSALRLTLHGPDAAAVTFDGRFEGGAAPVFRGRLQASTRDLPHLADWLTPVLPGLAAEARATLPARQLAFDGNVDLSGVGLAARDARLRLDATEVAGTLTYTRAVGPDRARLFADLTSDALDLDTLPDFEIMRAASSGLDLDLTMTARAVKGAPAGLGAIDAGRVGLRLHKVADTLALDSLSAELGSARLIASGRVDPRSAALDMHVDAPELAAVARLLSRLVPSPPTAWLDARAPALSPARVDLGLRAARASDGALVPTGLTLDGTLNGSRVKIGLAPDAPGDLDPATALFSIDLDADAPQGATLLRQLGGPGIAATANLPLLGSARLRGRAHGSVAEGFEATLDGRFAGAVLSFQGRARADHGSGHVEVKGSDVAPLLHSTGLLRDTGVWPADGEANVSWHDATVALHRLRGKWGGIGFAGDLDALLTPPASKDGADRPTLFGSLTVDRISAPAVLDAVLGASSAEPGALWSSVPFGAAPAQWPRTEVAIKTKSLLLDPKAEVRDASFALRASRGAVTFADLTGALRSGTFGGAMTLRRDGAAASISGAASWSGIGLDWPGLSGRVGGTLDFGGSGGSPAALVASLAGTGSMTVADGSLARFDPAALTRLAIAAEKTGADVDADRLKAELAPQLDRGPLRIGEMSGQATLAAGTLRFGPLRATAASWTADADMALDLKTFGFKSKTVLRVGAPLPDWTGEPPQLTVSLDGPAEAPRREIDSVTFVNVLQSRAIARDQERIDILAQDIRERAFFNRRRKAIEAEQVGARDKALADANASAATDEILRQMRQNPAAPIPSPPSRPTLLPGARATGRPPRSGRAPAALPPGAPDPLSAGRF